MSLNVHRYILVCNCYLMWGCEPPHPRRSTKWHCAPPAAPRPMGNSSDESLAGGRKYMSPIQLTRLCWRGAERERVCAKLWCLLAEELAVPPVCSGVRGGQLPGGP